MSTKLTVSALASQTRSDRVMVKLPGVASVAPILNKEGCKIYAELKDSDNAEFALAFARAL